MLDLIHLLGLPAIVVGRRGLGTINHTLMTLEVLRHAGVKVAGIILNETENVEEDFLRKDNPDAIARFGHAPIVGNIDYLSELNTDADAAWARFDAGLADIDHLWD